MNSEADLQVRERKMPRVIDDAPEWIYLQISDEPEDFDGPWPADAAMSGDVTWSDTPALVCEVPYVRADFLERAKDASAWIEQRAAENPVPPVAGDGYRGGFDMGYAIAMEHARCAFGAESPNAEAMPRCSKEEA